MHLTSTYKKVFLLIGAFCLSVLLLYFLKLQIGINILDSISISHYFPFKYLTTDIIKTPDSGILILEDFNKRRLFRSFTDLNMSERDTVSKMRSPHGYEGTACLLVTNAGHGTWVYPHRKMVKVEKGDRFQVEGRVYLQGDELSAGLSVAVYDKDQSIIKWSMFRRRIHKSGEWVGIDEQFEIPNDTIAYVRLRLVGSGKGICRFDDVLFRKLPADK
jgi:hypothetical protein